MPFKFFLPSNYYKANKIESFKRMLAKHPKRFYFIKFKEPGGYDLASYDFRVHERELTDLELTNIDIAEVIRNNLNEEESHDYVSIDDDVGGKKKRKK